MKSVRVGAIDYDVFVSPGAIVDDSARPMLGTVRYADCQIEIDGSIPPQKQHAVLWHEVIHAALEQAGVEIEHEEALATILGYSISQVLRDNP